MSVQAYRRAQVHSDTHRSTEYRLVSEITADMVRARDEGLRGGVLMAVLHRNREMWSTFGMLCDDDCNALPIELRARIVSLSLWVNHCTSAVMQGQEEMDALIDVNRLTLEGLGQTVSLPAILPTAA